VRSPVKNSAAMIAKPIARAKNGKTNCWSSDMVSPVVNGR